MLRVSGENLENGDNVQTVRRPGPAGRRVGDAATVPHWHLGGGILGRRRSACH